MTQCELCDGKSDVLDTVLGPMCDKCRQAMREALRDYDLPIERLGFCVDGCGTILRRPPGVPHICDECIERRR